MEPVNVTGQIPEELLFFADRGGAFTFVHSESKRPIESGWTERPHTGEEAARHVETGGNVSLLLGGPSDGTIAVDIDRGFKDILPILGPWADTVKVVRTNAPDRGKLIYRIDGPVPKSRSWKPSPKSKHPECELLSTGRHALIAPSRYNGGHYVLCDEHLGLRTVTVEELDAIWWLITGEHLVDEPKYGTHASNDGLVGAVKGAWPTQKVFEHFQRNGNGTVQQRDEVRLLGNGGLCINDWRWYCHAERVGGDQIDAWLYCRTGQLANRNDPATFLTVVKEMAAAAGIDTASYAPQSRRSQRTDVSVPALGETDDDAHSDLGNAKRFVREHGDYMRYTKGMGWLVYTGQRWAPDDTLEVERKAKSTVASIWEDAERLQISVVDLTKQAKAAGERGDEDALEGLENEIRQRERSARERRKWALKSQSRPRIEAMIALTASELPIATTVDAFDRSPWLLNVLNGTIDLRSGKLQPHSPGDMITRLAPVEYDPSAQCPTFLAFMDRITGGDTHLIELLCRWFGYCLTGDVSEQILPLFYGQGANGKSTLLNVFMEILGNGYAIQAAPELLLASGKDRHPTELADLHGKRLVASVEVDDGRRLAEGLVKQLTGGDMIKARFMHRDFFQFQPTHKLVLLTNHKPVVKGTDYAIWRRIRLVPFEVTIPESERDKTLPQKLRAEAPGILAWAVRGCLAWQERGLDFPESIRNATDSYRSESDTLAAFFSERCFTGETATAKAGDVYQAYRSWCEENGEHPLSGRAFGTRLSDRGVDKYRRNSGYHYLGLGLLDSEQS